jgi:hypothetical protein
MLIVFRRVVFRGGYWKEKFVYNILQENDHAPLQVNCYEISKGTMSNIKYTALLQNLTKLV